MNKTVKFVSDNNLCISCGLCSAVCLRKCINYSHVNGMNLPVIDSNQCTQCGICFDVCPGKGFRYREHYDDEFGLRNSGGIFTARTRDQKVLINATSGGIATEIISCLLRDGEYENAFVLQGYDYSDEVISTKIVSSDSCLKDSQRSRYLVISHRECAEYIMSHRSAKLILIGTSCFIHGILNMIRIFGLERRNYFMIGLFCDRTMSMNVIRYFRKRAAHGLREFHFRAKEAGGWPGGVRIVEDNGNIIDMPNTERMRVKDYFQPERCLYCLDKLNMYADMSIGDNYTGQHSYKDGSSSVIIRTDEGLRIWRKYESRFEVFESSTQEIRSSQYLKERRQNYLFGEIKSRMINHVINDIRNDIELNDTAESGKEYARRLSQIRIGEEYEDNPGALMRKLRARKIKTTIKRVLRKILFFR